MSYCPSRDWDQYVTQCEEGCEVCHRHVDYCDCPECGECGETGNKECYQYCGLPKAADSLQAFCEHVGIGGIYTALRAIDKHSSHTVTLVMCADGRRIGPNDTSAKGLPLWARVAHAEVTGIAWDGSDWEYSATVDVSGGQWTALDDARDGFEVALDEHRAIEEAERLMEEAQALCGEDR